MLLQARRRAVAFGAQEAGDRVDDARHVVLVGEHEQPLGVVPADLDRVRGGAVHHAQRVVPRQRVVAGAERHRQQRTALLSAILLAAVQQPRQHSRARAQHRELGVELHSRRALVALAQADAQAHAALAGRELRGGGVGETQTGLLLLLLSVCHRVLLLLLLWAPASS